jgi:hypothetical protein
MLKDILGGEKAEEAFSIFEEPPESVGGELVLAATH